MGRQKHNPGTRKQLARQAATRTTGQRREARDMARELVARGLASPLILSDVTTRRMSTPTTDERNPR